MSWAECPPCKHKCLWPRSLSYIVLTTCFGTSLVVKFPFLATSRPGMIPQSSQWPNESLPATTYQIPPAGFANYHRAREALACVLGTLSPTMLFLQPTRMHPTHSQFYFPIGPTWQRRRLIHAPSYFPKATTLPPKLSRPLLGLRGQPEPCCAYIARRLESSRS